MIIEELLPDHPNLVKRYSDQGYLIQNDQTGYKYEEAIDIIGKYTYTETNERPQQDEIQPGDNGYDEGADAIQAVHVLLGD